VIEVVLLCLLAGAIAGVFAGMLGLGGGLTTVPILNFVLPLAGVPEQRLMHAALAGSLVLMIVNTANAAYARWRHGHLDLRLFLRLAWPVFLGATIGVALADMTPDAILRFAFIGFIACAACGPASPPPSRPSFHRPRSAFPTA